MKTLIDTALLCLLCGLSVGIIGYLSEDAARQKENDATPTIERILDLLEARNEK